MYVYVHNIFTYAIVYDNTLNVATYILGWLTMLRNARLDVIKRLFVTVCKRFYYSVQGSKTVCQSLVVNLSPPHTPQFLANKKENLRIWPYRDFLLWESCLGLLAFFSLLLCLEEAFFWQFFDTEVPVLQDFEAGTRPCAATIGTNRGRSA